MNHRIPMLEALRMHAQANPLPLHVPGHKMGRGFPPEIASWFAQVLRLDVTELPGLDDLHQAEGAIRESQQLAAETFGSDETFFLVGGSTAGNMAMVLTVCRPGDTILVPRNAHKSIHNAVTLAGARPVYLYPEVDEYFRVPTVITVEEVRRCLAEHPEAQAVVITSPTYQGICSDVAAIAEEVHRHGKLFLVDEAHGAHFAFNEQLPAAAIMSGADLVVQSTHKMLGSLTGSAMLHGKKGRYDSERLRTMLGMVQTSSPSYLMMLSLDAVRYDMETRGRESLGRALHAVLMGRHEGKKIQGLDLLDRVDDAAGIDPFKWWIQVGQLGLTGIEAERWLRERQGIFLEMADEGHLLAVFSYADTEKQVNRLIKGLHRLAETQAGLVTDSHRKNKMKYTTHQFRLEQTMLPKDALHRSRRHVKLEVAEGQVAAEPVIPYPPGIPLILPGERYTAELVQYLQEMKETGTRFQGTADSSLDCVRVVE